MGEANGFVFLRDQQPLSAEERNAAARACGYIRRVVEERDRYIALHNLDPQVHFPQANWSLSNPIYDVYRRLVAGDGAVIEHLRLFSQMFTGYRLCELKSADGTDVLSAVPENLDATLEHLSHLPDEWVERYKLAIPDLPGFLKLGPPAKFGEIGWLIDGVIVNGDTCNYLERLALLHAAGLLDPTQPASFSNRRPITILEIGGGYGGLAYYLRRLIPHCRYLIVDLPESLVFSSIYLSTLFPDLENHYIEPATPDSSITASHAGLTFVPNYLFPRLRSAGLHVDLAINTLSMSEMSAPQVTAYCEGLRDMLGQTGVFFEQNQDNRTVGHLNAMDLIAGHFIRRTTLDVKAMRGITQGEAHLWRN